MRYEDAPMGEELRGGLDDGTFGTLSWTEEVHHTKVQAVIEAFVAADATDVVPPTRAESIALHPGQQPSN